MDSVVVQLAAGRGYVWDAADVKLLREKYRFIGALIGPKTGNTHQEHMPHSLPLLLQPEELQMGLKRGWFLIAPELLTSDMLSMAPAPLPSPEELDKLDVERPESATATKSPSQEHPLEQRTPVNETPTSSDTVEVDGQEEVRPSLQAEGRSEDLVGKARQGISSEGEVSTSLDRAEAQNSQETAVADKDSEVSESTAGEPKPALASGFPAGQLAKKKKGNREEEYWLSFADAEQRNVLTRSAGAVGEATTAPPALYQEESDRYVVYEDMYKRGYTITSGTNFGGNFLAYAGDPSDYHSEFVVRVLSDASRLPYPSLSAASRVALTARKKFMLALVTKEDGRSGSDCKRKVHYVVIAPDLVTASGVSRGLRAIPPPPLRKKS